MKFLEKFMEESREKHKQDQARQENVFRTIVELIRPAPATPATPVAPAADFAHMDREFDAVESMLAKGRTTEEKAALARSQISQKCGLGV